MCHSLKVWHIWKIKKSFNQVNHGSERKDVPHFRSVADLRKYPDRDKIIVEKMCHSLKMWQIWKIKKSFNQENHGSDKHNKFSTPFPRQRGIPYSLPPDFFLLLSAKVGRGDFQSFILELFLILRYDK